MKTHDDLPPASRLAAPVLRPLFEDDSRRDGPAWARALLALALGSLGILLARALLAAPARAPHVPLLVDEHLIRSGAQNPVTAVLLNFRAFDTLLEVAVLLVAMIAVWSLDRGSRRFGRSSTEHRQGPVLAALVRFAVPLIWIAAVYLVWVGSAAPGGAFQAGALLAGAGVLLSTTGYLRPASADSQTVRAAVALGLLVFVVLTVGPLPWTGIWPSYPGGDVGTWILVLELFLTLSIAVVLVQLFADVPAVPESDPSLAGVNPTGDPLGRALARLAGEDPDEEAGG